MATSIYLPLSNTRHVDVRWSRSRQTYTGAIIDEHMEYVRQHKTIVVASFGQATDPKITSVKELAKKININIHPRFRQALQHLRSESAA